MIRGSKNWYIAPIPENWYRMIAKKGVSSNAIKLALYLWFLKKTQKSQNLIVRASEAREFGVSRDKIPRALSTLQLAGVITEYEKLNRGWRVSILDVKINPDTPYIPKIPLVRIQEIMKGRASAVIIRLYLYILYLSTDRNTNDRLILSGYRAQKFGVPIPHFIAAMKDLEQRGLVKVNKEGRGYLVTICNKGNNNSNKNNKMRGNASVNKS